MNKPELTTVILSLLFAGILTSSITGSLIGALFGWTIFHFRTMGKGETWTSTEFAVNSFLIAAFFFCFLFERNNAWIQWLGTACAGGFFGWLVDMVLHIVFRSTSTNPSNTEPQDKGNQ